MKHPTKVQKLYTLIPSFIIGFALVAYFGESVNGPKDLWVFITLVSPMLIVTFGNYVVLNGARVFSNYLPYVAGGAAITIGAYFYLPSRNPWMTDSEWFYLLPFHFVLLFTLLLHIVKNPEFHKENIFKSK